MQEGNCGGESFALRVIGDTMAPEFKDGCIIIIDPSGVISDGCYVLARHNDEYIFRQLVYGDGVYYLKTLQAGHETQAQQASGDRLLARYLPGERQDLLKERPCLRVVALRKGHLPQPLDAARDATLACQRA